MCIQYFGHQLTIPLCKITFQEKVSKRKRVAVAIVTATDVRGHSHSKPIDSKDYFGHKGCSKTQMEYQLEQAIENPISR